MAPRGYTGYDIVETTIGSVVKQGEGLSRINQPCHNHCQQLQPQPQPTAAAAADAKEPPSQREQTEGRSAEKSGQCY